MTGAERLRMEGKIQGRAEGLLEACWEAAHRIIGGAEELGLDAKTFVQDLGMPTEVIRFVEILQQQQKG